MFFLGGGNNQQCTRGCSPFAPFIQDACKPLGAILVCVAHGHNGGYFCMCPIGDIQGFH